MLIFGEVATTLSPVETKNVFSEAEKQARMDWLDRVESMLELSRDENLSDFPKQGEMKSLEDYAWLD